MTSPIDDNILDARLTALETARSWSPRLMAKLEALIRSDQVVDLFRINPYRFAASRGIAPAESIDLFLHAADQRIFTMEWLLVCPGCSSTVSSFRSLHTVHTQFHCGYCNADWQTTLDDFIDVVFTIAPDLRAIPYHTPDSLTADDYCYHYRLSGDGLLPGTATPFAEALRRVTPALDFLQPGGVTRMTINVPPETVVLGWSLESDSRFCFEVSGTTSDSAQTLSIRVDGGVCTPDCGTIAPGPLIVAIDNAGDTRSILGISLMPRGFTKQALDFAPFLSGKRLVTTQTFRDLFRAEVVGASEGLGIRDVTLLFTDLKGSTALYDTIGDLNAFALVQRHFEHLRVVTAAAGGAVVKTIGDAVMATFIDPVSAVGAALDMLRAIEKVNQNAGRRDLVLKIGLHRGAAIAVTLNDRLDYFGQTVNVAARVQGLADAAEIYLSAEVYDSPGVPALLAQCRVERQIAKLKGIGHDTRVYRITPGA